MFDPGPDITIPPMVSVFTKGIGWVDESIAASAPVSAGTFGQVLYYPIILPASCTVRRVWWANGVAVAGNVDVGIYADSGDHKPGALLISSGATAASGTNAVQFADVADTIIGPGLYWLAMVEGGATTMFRSDIVAAYDAPLRYQESGSTLPATATPVESTGPRIYLFGFSTVASP